MRTFEEKVLPSEEDPKLDEGGRHPRKRGGFSLRALFIILVAAIVIGCAFLFGYSRRRQEERAANQAAQDEANALPVVNVVKVRRAASTTDLALPGNIAPVTEAYIYARASGYVRKRYADIGDRVKAGQLLAEIEAPDLDQQVQQAKASAAQASHQLQQAKANLEQYRAQLELARVTWQRYQNLVKDGAVSRQEADQEQASYRTAEATVNAGQASIGSAQQNVQASQANLDRLISMHAFLSVRAPFNGVITARNFDVGAFISSTGSASSSSPAGLELFREAQIDTLRIFINVPQENSPSIHVGQPAAITVQQLFGRQFSGKVTRTAQSLDPNTRTLLTEVQTPNTEHLLLPGMYARVRLVDQRSHVPMLVPSDSLIQSANGLEVAILRDLDGTGPANRSYPPDAKRVHLQIVEAGRDYGADTEITTGLEGWEYVIVNPGDAVQEGAVVKPLTVQIAAPAKAAAAH
ncbi:MAG: efflux RND transporter periplasmic adaptor subunit [Bryobacteraceae bacterium]